MMSDPYVLMRQKVDQGEYGEALNIAQTNDLNTDLIYERQWELSPVTQASIQSYLDKVKDRKWVLDQCIERTSEQEEGTRQCTFYYYKKFQSYL